MTTVTRDGNDVRIVCGDEKRGIELRIHGDPAGRCARIVRPGESCTFGWITPVHGGWEVSLRFAGHVAEIHPSFDAACAAAESPLTGKPWASYGQFRAVEDTSGDTTLGTIRPIGGDIEMARVVRRGNQFAASSGHRGATLESLMDSAWTDMQHDPLIDQKVARQERDPESLDILLDA